MIIANTDALAHFKYYLEKHPEIEDKTHFNIGFVFDEDYQFIVEYYQQYNNKSVCYAINSNELINVDQRLLLKADLVVVLFDRFRLNFDEEKYENKLHPLQALINDHIAKVVMLVDLGEQFNEVYYHSPKKLNELNLQLQQRLVEGKHLHITDKNKSHIDIDISASSKWTNLNGLAYGECLPAEVAGLSRKINGELYFTGAILAKVPFIEKYGLITSPIHLTIEKGRIIDFKCDDKELYEDLEFYFNHHDNHRDIEEIGFGTNIGLSQLYPINASFIERTPGLHFGLSGKLSNTFHMDLIFDSAIISLDDKILYDGNYHFS